MVKLITDQRILSLHGSNKIFKQGEFSLSFNPIAQPTFDNRKTNIYFPLLIPLQIIGFQLEQTFFYANNFNLFVP